MAQAKNTQYNAKDPLTALDAERDSPDTAEVRESGSNSHYLKRMTARRQLEALRDERHLRSMIDDIY